MGNLKDDLCVSVALFGLGMIGAGLFMMYEPLAWIYGGLVVIYLANLGTKQK